MWHSLLDTFHLEVIQQLSFGCFNQEYFIKLFSFGNVDFHLTFGLFYLEAGGGS